MEGKKFDAGKPRWSLVPEGAMEEVIKVLEYGAQKYAVDNWKHVIDGETRYYDAAMRHVDAWWRGETKDPETGLHHLAHATCCLMFLIWLDRWWKEEQNCTGKEALSDSKGSKE